MSSILDSFKIGWLNKDRVGLNISLELYYNDKLAENLFVYLPVEQSSVIKMQQTNQNYLLEMSMIQEKSLSQKNLESSMIIFSIVAAVAILCLSIIHFLEKIRLRAK